jgi:sulfur carrier protein ThiS
MKIRVKLFATLIRHVPEPVRACYPQGIRAGVPLEIELPEHSTLADLVNYLNLPQEQVRVTFVNGRTRPLDHGLVSGDEVGLFPPVGGG